MTAPFVSQLRVGPDVVRLGANGEGVLHLRAQLPEVWDAVRVDATASTKVIDLKRRALEELAGSRADAGDYVIKLRGFEVLDENATLEEAGALDGSTFLLMNRRRRPVR
jgi:hypothetical protein